LKFGLVHLALWRTKQAFHKWKIDGSIKEPRNALYKEMKESKKTLRQKLRQAAARIRENKYNDIMESADFNQQLFYAVPVTICLVIWYCIFCCCV
jgi:ribosomal protein RSM22 (predicted rRNA methylase)